MAEPLDRRIRHRGSAILVAVYWVALLAGTHWPRQLLPREKLLFSRDKLLHFSAYAGLTFLLLNAVRLRRLWPPAGAQAAFVLAAVVCLVVSISGLVDEITQPLVGRDFEWYDWLADSSGAICGAVLSSIMLRRYWTMHAERVMSRADVVEPRAAPLR
jgi:VanZ family protein